MLRAQTDGKVPFVPASCEDYKTLVAQAWEVEENLIKQATNSPVPATGVRYMLEKAKAIDKQLSVCVIKSNGPKEKSDLLLAESRNFGFILEAQRMNAGLALGSERMLATRSGFPLDLADVAPSCEGRVQIVGSSLSPTKPLQQIEAFMKDHDPSSVPTLKEVEPLFLRSEKLVNCAWDAYKAGYKDAAFRILNADFALVNYLTEADAHEQAAVVRVIQSVSPSAPAQVTVGRQHCTANIQNFGWQKTISWECY